MNITEMTDAELLDNYFCIRTEGLVPGPHYVEEIEKRFGGISVIGLKSAWLISRQEPEDQEIILRVIAQVVQPLVDAWSREKAQEKRYRAFEAEAAQTTNPLEQA